MAYITKHEFNIQKEQKEGEIRWEILKGLDQDLRAEQGRTEVKRIRADIAWENSRTEQVRLQIASEQTNKASWELQGAIAQTQQAQIQAGIDEDKTVYLGLKRQAQFSIYREQLYALDIQIGELQTGNQHRVTELSGSLGGAFAPSAYSGSLTGGVM